MARQRKIRRRAKGALDGEEGSLGLALARGEAHLPVVDLDTAAKPVVGEAEDEDAGDPVLKAGFDLPGEDFAFLLLAFAPRIDPGLADDEGARVGDHLQAGEIIFEGAPLVQVDVEAMEVDVARAQKFRCREIAKGAEAFGVDGFGFRHEFIDEFRHATWSAPAHDIAGDFVHHAKREHGRMPRAQRHGVTHGGAGVGARRRRIQKEEVLSPRNVHEHFQPVFLREVEEPVRRHVIDPQRIGAEFADAREVQERLLARGVGFARGVGGERPVSDAARVELGLAEPEELSIHADACRGNVRRHRTKLSRPSRLSSGG